MPVSTRELRWLLVPGFLAAQALLIHLAAGGERPPAPPDLATFPARVGAWTRLADDPIAADVAAQLKADRLLSQTYIDPSTGAVANLFVAWFNSQRGGDRQPHSPKVCLPGSGWIPEETGEITLETAAGSIRVNRYVATNRGAHAEILYWYQTPRRAVAGEWAAKIWLVADALRDRRTDTALVRIVVPLTPGRTAAAAAFARAVYPPLRELLPH
jgi:EpsI family protein